MKFPLTANIKIGFFLDKLREDTHLTVFVY
jgi:hypothetical protein